VAFIRDCAEMAARASLTRSESRWGLYHERADLPDRDDERWNYHLNLRKGGDGSMEFVKRPVAPYFVPVPGFDHVPSSHPPVRVEQPPLASGQAPGSQRSRVPQDSTAPPPSPRIAEVLALESPALDELTQYLADPDNGVRRTAVATLVENLPDGYEPALLTALADRDAGVRRAAADGFRELVEVLSRPEGIAAQLSSADAWVRAAAVYVVSSRRVGGAKAFRRALADDDHRVRTEAVRALVSVDDSHGVALAAADENREVRIAAANGLATLQAGVQVVRRLVGDGDPLVRAAALAALGSVGFDDGDVPAVEKALSEPAWQIREGAARALSGATPEVAVPALTRALNDPHLDVRKAAVLSLTRWAATEDDAQRALSTALDDRDADVRAYARRAMASAC
jgi:HEAT repeat protein